MEIQDFSHHLEGIEAAIKRQLERDLPKKLGNLAVRMFKENFQKESFFGRAWLEVPLQPLRQEPRSRQTFAFSWHFSDVIWNGLTDEKKLVLAEKLYLCNGNIIGVYAEIYCR